MERALRGKTAGLALCCGRVDAAVYYVVTNAASDGMIITKPG
jgi:hypothetical protein